MKIRLLWRKSAVRLSQSFPAKYFAYVVLCPQRMLYRCYVLSCWSLSDNFVKSSQMRSAPADAGTLCLFARTFITQYVMMLYQIITHITLILTSVSSSGYVTREIIVHIITSVCWICLFVELNNRWWLFPVSSMQYDIQSNKNMFKHNQLHSVMTPGILRHIIQGKNT